MQLTDFILILIKSGRAILDKVVNKHSLGRYLTGFLVLNKDLPPRSGRLTTIGLKVTNIKIRQVGESLALILQTYLWYTFNIINPLAF